MDSGNDDFALLVRPDGGLHFIMETPFSIEAAAIHAGAQAAYQITRSRDGVRVTGRSMGRDCVLEHRKPGCREQRPASRSASLPDYLAGPDFVNLIPFERRVRGRVGDASRIYASSRQS